MKRKKKFNILDLKTLKKMIKKKSKKIKTKKVRILGHNQDIDSGVAKLVKTLNEKGFETLSSCSGMDKDHYDKDYGFTFNPETKRFERNKFSKMYVGFITRTSKPQETDADYFTPPYNYYNMQPKDIIYLKRATRYSNLIFTKSYITQYFFSFNNGKIKKKGFIHRSFDIQSLKEPDAVKEANIKKFIEYLNNHERSK
ncbi:hypothetical protein LCGC14_1161010 [marine sediment metagenome]|uniref:Uncharacterized protein n=1 Tax=marine sediment metagenome TaxID=412755 RepID=A0A0F9PY95_9ZZZZ